MLTASQVMNMLHEFVASEEGKKFLRENGVFCGVAKEETEEAAKALRTMVVQASSTVCSSGSFLSDNDASIRINGVKEQNDGRYKITLSFNKELLKRDSLLSSSTGKPIGDGVYDLIGLRTKGYKRDKGFVYGYWSKRSAYVRSHSLLNGKAGLEPNDFVDRAIRAFRAAYPYYKMEINYPSLWHSK